MDQPKVPQLDAVGGTIRKKRSQPSRRRPIPEGESFPDRSPMSSAPVSDDMSKVSSDENMDGNSGGKMFNLNHCVSRSLPVIESNMIPSNGASGKAGSENRLKKVKLKVGGVTPTTQTNGASTNDSPVNTNQFSDSTQPRQRLGYEGTFDEYRYVSTAKKSGLQGIPWKDFSKGSFSIGREDMGRTLVRNAVESKGDKSDTARKSKRVRKRRVLDEDFDEEDEDDEIRYLEKLKTSKMTGYKDFETQPDRKHQKGGKSDNLGDSGKLGIEARKSRSGDTDYEEEEEEALSDGKPDDKKKKKQKKDLSELQTEKKRETALTTRQRALLSKDSSSAGASQIEFPNGLPPVPNRKSKEKLSEVEQQLKKAEVAQRRRLQNEKAARESEEEAIRKILGQDSSRKKREEKIKKRQEELAQEKVANALMLASNTVRTVMGPNGTIVTFPQEMGFPKIFEPRLCSYPPPREMCAGPSCSNPYKYRDSKSMLPLCSLQCYKAINERTGAEKTC